MIFLSSTLTLFEYNSTPNVVLKTIYVVYKIYIYSYIYEGHSESNETELISLAF